ncbi:MAG: PKD domain-containing protein [Bacteroidota bacterium]
MSKIRYYKLIVLIFLFCIGYNNVYSQFNIIHDIPWRSDTVGMWGPSSYTWSIDQIDTLVNIEVGPYDSTHSFVHNFGLFDSVGVIFDYGTYMAMMLVFEMTGWSGGEAYVNYPTKIDMGFPNNMSFTNGDWITITSDYRELDSTIYPADNDKWRLYSNWPEFGKIRLYINFDVQANIDIIYSDFQDPFNIVWDTINIIPPINIDLDTFDIFLIDAVNGEYKIPWVDYHYDAFGNPVIDSVYFIQDSVGWPIEFPAIFYDLIGITGDIQLPDIETVEWIEDEQRLYAWGNSEYMHIQLDIIKFVQVMCHYLSNIPQLAPLEQVSQAMEYEEGDTTIFIMTDPISGEDFTIDAAWDLIDAELLLTNTMNQNLAFCDDKEYYDIFGQQIPPDHYPNVWNVFEFPAPIDYKIYDLNNTMIEQGTSDSIKYGADYDIDLKYPCFDYDTLDITTTHTIDPWLTNLVRDSIDVDFYLKILDIEYSIGTPSNPIIQGSYLAYLDTITLGTFAGPPLFGPPLQMPWQIEGYFPDTTFVPDIQIVPNYDPLEIVSIISQDTLCYYSNYAEVNAIGGTGPYEYVWTDGVDTLSTDSGISNLNIGTVIYYITVTDANNCTNDTNITVTLNPNPSASAINNGSVCEGAILTLSGGPVGMLAYLWTGPDSFISLSQSPVVSTNATTAMAGVYTLTVIDANDCIDDTNTTVTVNTNPSASTTNNSPVCEGAILTLTGGQSGMSSYSWTGPDSFSSLSQSPIVSTNATTAMAGVYTLTVIDTNGCTDDTNTTVTVNTNPSASATNSGPVCEGAILTLTGGPGGMSSYSWTGPDSFSSLSQSPTVSINATTTMAGVYTLSVTDTNGCTDDTNTTVTVNTNPSASAINNGPVCEGAILSLTGGAGGMSSYSWIGPDSFSSLLQSPVVSINATTAMAGVYTLTVTDANGCTDDTNTTVTVNANPSASATNNYLVCEGAILTLAGGPGGMSFYSWVGPDSFSSLLQSPIVSTNATSAIAGVYTLIVTDANGCIDDTTLQVEVYTLPQPGLTADTSRFCSPWCVEFTDKSNITSGSIAEWAWDVDNDGNVDYTTQNPTHCYINGDQISITYDVTLIATSSGGCSDTLTMVDMITVWPNPVAGFMADPNPASILYPYITFTNTSSGAISDPVIYLWNFGDSTTWVGFDTIHAYNDTDTGTYTVELFVENSFGCFNTIALNVVIEGDYTLFMPNAFTPNKDDINDTFFPMAIGIDEKEFEMYIFDRWGDIIYETNDINKPWDGRANNGRELAQEDVYVWLIYTKDILGKRHQYIGHVTLIR